MRKVNAHVTVDGTPLCKAEGHLCGLLNTHGLTCGHTSLAAAHRTKRVVQKHRHSVRVVRGECPA